MERPVPLWLVLLLLLVGSLITTALCWAVKSTVGGSGRTGAFGRAAVAIASFPDQTRTVFNELKSRATGDYRDEANRVPREDWADYASFSRVQSAPGFTVAGLRIKRTGASAARGWRLIAGAFDVNGEMENAAILLNPDLRIVKYWRLTEIPVGNAKPRPKYRKFVHGVELLKDGSLIFAYDLGVSLQRLDSCGKRLWVTPGAFNHAVTLDERSATVWTLSNEHAVAQISVSDGTVLREIDMEKVVDKNPQIDILEILRIHSTDFGKNTRNTEGRWVHDPYHLNDVDPLPSAWVNSYPEFEAGDLLISARSLNLVFVLDPDTLHIKWWRIGATQRQHDPDWSPSGKINVFNNRMSRDFSEIVSLDPQTFERTTLFDGRENNFYTRIRGKFQITSDGYMVVTSPQQGRAFEVTPDGDIALEIANLKPNSRSANYVISELKWFPLGWFNLESWRCPPVS